MPKLKSINEERGMNCHLRPRSITRLRQNAPCLPALPVGSAETRAAGSFTCFFITPALKYALRLTTGLVFLFWFGALIMRAADRYVVPPGTPGGTNTGEFTDWTIAATQIQWAVDAAAAGETVWVTNGTYNLTNRITISTAITNSSVNGPTVTFINGNYPAYTNGCFVLHAKVYLTGFTITNGYAATNYGGGIEMTDAAADNSVVTNCVIAGNYCSYTASEGCAGGISLKNVYGSRIANCIISNNYANSAGGIFIHSGLIVGSLVIANTATNGDGGGIYMACAGTVSNCIIQANIAPKGAAGGINAEDGHGSYCYIYNSTITQNRGNTNASSWKDGGGIWIRRGLLKDCIISSNLIDYSGGGVSIGDSDVTVQNCIIIDNSVASYGGGVSIGAGVVQNCLVAKNIGGSGGGVRSTANSIVRDCTIVSNRSGSGGGIYSTATSPKLENSIVYVNTATSESNNYYGAFAATNSCSYPLLDGTDNITNDPVFASKDTDNWRLKANSPCINRGKNQEWMTNAVDLDGRMRIRYGRVDMGAYEKIYEGTIYTFY